MVTHTKTTTLTYYYVFNLTSECYLPHKNTPSYDSSLNEGSKHFFVCVVYVTCFVSQIEDLNYD